MLEHLWEHNWELQQNRSIRDARGNAQRAQEKAQSLESQVEALVLLNQALVELLAERLGIGEEQILAKVSEIDQRDGTRDGRLAGAAECSQCHRPVSRRLQRCIYCGAPSASSPIITRVKPAPPGLEAG